MNNLALTSYNKRFLYAAVGAPGSTHDARMLKESSFFDEVLSGRALPDRKINLGGFRDIPLVTIGDSAFPRFSWLIKCCKYERSAATLLQQDALLRKSCFGKYIQNAKVKMALPI